MKTQKINGVLYEIKDPPLHGNYRGAMGRSTEYVECPFCNNNILVYVWSFYGCGRKCECGAKLSGHASLKRIVKK
jgi:hypothetical protein